MDHNRRSSAYANLTLFEKMLYDMNKAGGFQVSVLSSMEGLPIATVPASYSSDLLAAMVALLQKVSNDAQGQLGMAQVDEMIICDHDRVRLVCRYLTIGGEKLILAALVPPNRPYRQATNRAIRRIEELL